LEKHGLVWIWMGEPALAEAALIPDFSFMEREDYAVVTGYLHVKANYELISDNLLDLSHLHYLHPQIKPENGFENFENRVVQEGNTVWSKLWKPSYMPSAFQRSLWGSDSPTADGRSDVRWNAPSLLIATSALCEVGQPIDEGAQLPNAHLITPETEFTSHYFWSVGRSVRLNEPEMDAQLKSVVGAIFSTQDAPIIESQQRAMGANTDFLSQKPVILKADGAGIRARRVLKRLLQAEQQGEAIAAE
jgi:phenylpropionate dioxygenase-like ring-hydroxylating dioxygenase large terminal subunit